MDKTDGRIVLLGRITGAHGIRGEVSLQSFTEVPEAIGSYGELQDARGTRRFRLSNVRFSGKRLTARVDGVSDRNAAEALAGQELFVARSRLPPAADDEFYHADLVGLIAHDGDGKEIGEVVAVQNFGAGDLLEVRLSGSQRTELFPFTKATVPVIDLPSRRLVITIDRL